MSSPDAPTPPEGQAPEPATPAAGDSPQRDWQSEIRTAEKALDAERKLRARAEQQLSQAKQQQMTDAEKQIAAAKLEGRAEAMKEAGVRLAAAEFRALAAGKLPDPTAALEYLDLSRFVGEDGTPDSDAMTAAVDKLVGALVSATRPSAPAVTVPAGPRADPGEADWLRSQMSR